MAYTESDVIAADQQIKQAEANLSIARAKQQAILANPDPQVQFTQGAAAKAEVDAAKDAVSSAIRNYQRVNATFNAQQKNSAEKPLNPLQETQRQKEQEQIKGVQAENAAKQRNLEDPSVGAYVTDAVAAQIRRQRAEAANGKPPRNDSPVQRQEAATRGAAQVETGRHNLATEGQNVLETQVQAQIAAVNAGQRTLSDVMQQETARMRTAQDAQETARSAAQGLLSADVTMRGQDQNHIQARASFLSSIFNSIMSHGMQMMRGLPKGDQTAVKWVKAAMGMMNDLYHQAGLDRELPRPNPNSPAIKALETLSGTARGAVPVTPPVEFQSTVTAVLNAVVGYPGPNWNGPIGADAIPLLHDLDAARTAMNLPPVGNHGPVRPEPQNNDGRPSTGTPSTTTPPTAPAPSPAPTDDPEARRHAALNTLISSKEGQNVVRQYITPDIQALADRNNKSPGSLRPEEKAKLDKARQDLADELDRRNPPPQPVPAAPAPTTEAPPRGATTEGIFPGMKQGVEPTPKPEDSKDSVGQALSFDAMHRQIEMERDAKQKQGVTLDDTYTTAQEALDRLRNGEKPAVTAYNNENDAVIGNSYTWEPYVKKESDTEPAPTYKLRGPDEDTTIAENQLNKPTYTPQKPEPFVPPDFQLQNLVKNVEPVDYTPPSLSGPPDYTPQFTMPDSFLPQQDTTPSYTPTVMDPGLTQPNYDTYDPGYSDPSYFVPPDYSSENSYYQPEPAQEWTPPEWYMPEEENTA